MKSRLLAAGLVAGFLTVTPAFADHRSDCAQSDVPSVIISSCGHLIADGKETAEVKAIAYANRGTAYQKNADFDAAIADYTAAIKLNPKLARAYFNRGVGMYRKKETKSAIADFSEAIRLDPKDPEPFVNRAIVQFELGQYAPSIADMSSAIRLSPKMPLLFLYRGKIYLAQGDAKRAAADFRHVLELDPTDATAKALLKDLE